MVFEAELACPEVTTSRSELPVAVLAATRRFPFGAVAEVGAAFSLVLEAVEVASSGWARGLEGGMVRAMYLDYSTVEDCESMLVRMYKTVLVHPPVKSTRKS